MYILVFYYAALVAANVNQLRSKTARKEWEQQFNVSYIEPVLNQLEVLVAKALDLVANDDQQGVVLPMYYCYSLCPPPEQDRLFYLAYEKVKVDEGKLEAHLWSYRPQINLEHLKSKVQAVNECKILDTFLKIVSVCIHHQSHEYVFVALRRSRAYELLNTSQTLYNFSNLCLRLLTGAWTRGKQRP